MSLQILLREQPERSIALVTDSNALNFRYSPIKQSFNSSVRASSARCIVEFSSIGAIDLTDYRPLLTQPVHGTLGLINVNSDTFICIITAASAVATLRPGEIVQRIISVEFFCLNRADYDRWWRDEAGLYDYSDNTSDLYEGSHGIDHKDPQMEHPCLPLKHALGGGTFYYSVEFDLTNRLQNRVSEESAFDVDNFDHAFLWNSYMIEPLIQFRSQLNLHDKKALDASHILTSAIRGFVSTITIPASSSPMGAIDTNLPSTLTLISRLSWYRAGTRFNARGIDDDGNAANFVETETIYYFPNGLCFSYAQVRGSVPMFWEQATGILPQQQKIQITRSPEATQPAFNKHFESLELKYGTIHILNLLGESKPGEAELTARYNYHIQHCSLNQGLAYGQASDRAMLQASHFDFHAETRGPGGYEAAILVRHLIREQAEGFAFFMLDVDRDFYKDRRSSQMTRSNVTLQQEGVFRTNCLDCLDRTNLIQTIISQMALESFFRQWDGHPLADYWMRHSTLWADNGDALSKIYAGTGALKSSFTRHGKMSLAGAIADARKSATRIYMNNFADKGRQNVIDTLLGRLVDQMPVQLYDPVNDYVNSELARRAGEYSRTEDISIWVGTFNLNGKGKGVREDLSAWLCPILQNNQRLPEIVAVGFQEIIELTANNIMSTDPKRRQDWEAAVARTLNNNARKSSEEYVLLRSGQLVGAALIVFVKISVLRSIKNVEGSIKKTGLSGMAGNKGAVAIRLDYANTRICFITAHLAAGFANYDERNKDYQTISHGLRFQGNRSIEDHDSILWLGDFNYRIGLDGVTVHQDIQDGDLGNLFKNDQLNLQMVAGNTFPYYNEAPITFLPTYKYDNGTDQYDTSEKARIPAWCDRILWRGENLKQIVYEAAPLRFSDHRPVFGTFQCAIRAEDERVKQGLSREIYFSRREQVRHSLAMAGHGHTEDEDLLGFESISPGLAPASSEHRKWWLNNGLPARSNILESHKGQTPNPRRPANPFTPSEEPDWVLVSKTSSLPEMRKSGGQVIPRPPMGAAAQSNSLETNIAGPRVHTLEHTADHGHGRNPRLRMTSTASTTSSPNFRKSAPPVPKKPVTLVAGTPQKTQETSIPFYTGGSVLKDSLYQLKAAQPIADRSAPTPWETSNDSQRESQQTASLDPSSSSIKRPPVGESVVDLRPPLPSRPLPRPVGNMMDEQDAGAQSIPALQPSRIG